MSGKLSRYRRLVPHLTRHSQRPALPGSNRAELSREAFAWLSMTASGLLALRIALASSSVSSGLVTSSPRWMKSQMEASRMTERRGDSSPGSRFSQFVQRLSRLNVGTMSFTPRTIRKPPRHQLGTVASSALPTRQGDATRSGGFCPTIVLGMLPSEAPVQRLLLLLPEIAIFARAEPCNHGQTTAGIFMVLLLVSGRLECKVASRSAVSRER